MLEYLEFGDRVAEGCAEENVGREVSAGRDARKADRRGESVRCDWHPAMMVISIRDDSRDREGADRMTGWKAAFGEVRLPIVKKSVVERAARWNGDRALALRDHLQSDIDDLAVNECLASEQTRVHLICVMTNVTRREE